MCYVLGANPPLQVTEGFLRRIWGEKGIDRIAPIGNGFFIVRFLKVKVCDTILKGGFNFFDGKPLIVQAWRPDMEWTKKIEY